MDNSKQPIINCANKPRKCEKCGGEVLSILYGYPAPESFKAAGRGEIIIGGVAYLTTSIISMTGYARSVASVIRNPANRMVKISA